MSLKVEQYFLEGKKIDFELERKRSVRRNILVRFEDDGRMKVSAPLRSSRQSIHSVLSDMHDQIVDLRRQVRERNRGLSPTRYRQGSRQLYLGRTYTLDIWRDANTRPKVILRSDHIEVHVPEWGEEVVRDTLWRWYRQQAQHHFSQRMDHIAGSISWLRRASFELRLRRMKRSWGTCSANGVITLNPLLMKAPTKYIDYVIAHELCHLREHNHSPAFYRLLEQLIPNWDNLRRALNERSHIYLRW